jgi:hypothetical protein
MRTLSSILMLLLLAAPCALAQSEENPAPAESADEAAAKPDREEVPIPPKVQPPDDDGIPQVSIRTQDNGDRVEEYRQNGKLYMVKVTPRNAPPYYLLDTNGDGRLDAKDGEGRVAPVYWTIYEWD